MVQELRQCWPGSTFGADRGANGAPNNKLRAIDPARHAQSGALVVGSRASAGSPEPTFWCRLKRDPARSREAGLSALIVSLSYFVHFDSRSPRKPDLGPKGIPQLIQVFAGVNFASKFADHFAAAF
jgi:hypothetical protein